MTDEQREIILEARRFWREKASAYIVDEGPLPEFYPHHYEDTLGVEHIPYEPGDKFYASTP